MMLTTHCIEHIGHLNVRFYA